MADRRKAFWPVVLLGLLGSGLTAYAGSKPWLGGVRTPLEMATLTKPAVNALGLAAMAAWGVLLVTRRTGRRVMAVVIGLLAVGAVTYVVSSRQHPTVWPWAAGLGAFVALGAAVLALFWAPSWPEMGRKYDAPQAPVGLDTDDNAGLWRSLSEGRDPTEDGNA